MHARQLALQQGRVRIKQAFHAAGPFRAGDGADTNALAQQRIGGAGAGHGAVDNPSPRLDLRPAQVSLQVGNVLDPALANRDGLYDFVFCRNLLIYFDVATQQRVFEVLKRLLHPQGVLFIGPAEGSLLARMGMRPLGIAQSFAYVRHEGDSAPLAAA